MNRLIQSLQVTHDANEMYNVPCCCNLRFINNFPPILKDGMTRPFICIILVVQINIVELHWIKNDQLLELPIQLKTMKSTPRTLHSEHVLNFLNFHNCKVGC